MAPAYWDVHHVGGENADHLKKNGVEESMPTRRQRDGGLAIAETEKSKTHFLTDSIVVITGPPSEEMVSRDN